MLHEIRNNRYKPDETRSGRLQHDSDISSAQAFLSRGDELVRSVLPPAQSVEAAVEASVPSKVAASDEWGTVLSDIEHVTTGSFKFRSRNSCETSSLCTCDETST